jgi:hypothetical protein
MVGAGFILFRILARAFPSAYREPNQTSWLWGPLVSFPDIESPDGREELVKYLSKTYLKFGIFYFFLGVILLPLPDISQEVVFLSSIVMAILVFVGIYFGRSLGIDKALEIKRKLARASEAGKIFGTIVCPSCKKQISEEYNQCPWCGSRLR